METLTFNFKFFLFKKSFLAIA